MWIGSRITADNYIFDIVNIKNNKQLLRACYTNTPTRINASRLLQANHQQHQKELVCTQIP